MINISISGASGHMGRAIIACALNQKDVKLQGGLVRNDSPHLGVDLGLLAALPEVGKQTSSDVKAAVSEADVVLLFSSTESCIQHLPYYVESNKRLVIGTTAFTPEQKAEIQKAAKHIPIVMAPNMSLGINLCLGLVKKAASVLKDYDVEIIESHGSHKKDAPSGSALELGHVVAETRGQSFEEVADFHRFSKKASREKNAIGFSSIRGTGLVGQHTVMFAGPHEVIEIAHTSHSREAYAEGSIAAARWLLNQKPGLYDMQDVLGLR